MENNNEPEINHKLVKLKIQNSLNNYQFTHGICTLHYNVNAIVKAVTVKEDLPAQNAPKMIALSSQQLVSKDIDNNPQFEVYYCSRPTLFVTNNPSEIFYNSNVGDVIKSKIMYCNLDDTSSMMHTVIQSYQDGHIEQDLRIFFY